MTYETKQKRIEEIMELVLKQDIDFTPKFEQLTLLHKMKHFIEATKEEDTL